jgi:hypothetical protein
MSGRQLAAVIGLAALLPALEASALSLALGNLLLVPPAAPINETDLTLSTDVAGSDTETVTLSGQISAELDFQFVGGNVIPTGLTLTSGTVAFSDVTFSFLLGFVEVQTSGLAGTPFTTNPPGTVLGTTFPANEHALLVDQGIVDAAGSIIDFSQTPAVFDGTAPISSPGIPTSSPLAPIGARAISMATATPTGQTSSSGTRTNSQLPTSRPFPNRPVSGCLES